MEEIDWRDVMQRIGHGDQVASEQLFDSYVHRLLRLVESRLSGSVSRRVDADDIVQSVFRTFFRRSATFKFERSGDLWRLLSAIAIRKVRKQVSRQTAGKRDVRRETVDGLEHATLPEPTPLEVAAVQEILENFLRTLPRLEGNVLKMRLEGDSLAKIGHQLQRSQRTVRRILHQLQHRLLAELREDPIED